MKFHWGDFLNREGGHWAFTPNAERGQYWTEDCANLPSDTRIVTVTRDTKNLDRLSDLDILDEITLHETNQAQIDALYRVNQIRRLRITHARPKSLHVLTQLNKIEELVLEYVSGFDDLRPLAEMPALRAVHLENLRRVNDFSPLGDASGLRYLSIMGTFDWAQPIHSLAFASRLNTLEYLSVIGRLGVPESARELVAIGNSCTINFADNFLPIEEFAYLEARCANVSFDPVIFWPRGPATALPTSDHRSKLSEEEIKSNHPEIIICEDGRRLLHTSTEYDVYHLLGQGARDIRVNSKNAAKKAAAYEKKYREMVEAFAAAAR